MFFVMKTTIWFICRNLWLMARNKWQRFGYACVNFGPPISAREYCREHDFSFRRLDRKSRFFEVEKLCKNLMASIEQIVPVLPVSLVATVFLEDPEEWLSEFDVKAYVHRLIEELQSKGARVYLSKKSGEHTITTALNMLKLRRLVVESDGLLRADQESLPVLSYYANAIDHWRQHQQSLTSEG
jgi:glycerol-3-phosphate O-acyltransferase